MLWAVAILCVFAVSVFANPLTRERAVETIVKIRNLEFHKISHRFYRWRIAVEMFKEHPYFGIGVNNFRLQQKAFIPKELKKPRLRRILVNEKYNAHNHYLNVLSEQGIFGFVVFICLVSYLVSLGIGNAMRGGNEFFALAIVSYFITAMFEYSWGDYSSLFMFWFVVILNVIERRNLEAIAKP
jgi:O-antigen ligase